MTDIAAAIHAYNVGIRAIQEGDVEAAAAAWRSAVEIDPGMSPALRNLVVYHEDREETGTVVELYGQILAFDPYDTEALIRQAAGLKSIDRSAEAIANYQKAIGIYPYFRFWYHELAEIFQEAGDAANASVWRSRAAALDSDEAEMAFEDGVRHLRSGNLELAITIFEAVVEDQPANLDARVRLAGAMHGVGRTNDALDLLAEAAELTDTASALVLFHRARILIEIGRNEDGIADLERAIEHDAAYGRAARLLEHARGGPPGKPLAKSPEPESPEPARQPARTEASANVRSSDPRSSGSHAPFLEPPPTDLPWLEQVRFVVRNTVDIASRTGQPGRICVFLEAAAQLVPVANSLIALVGRPDLHLVKGGQSRVYVIESESTEGSGTHGIAAEGWLGTSYFEPNYGKWGSKAPGLPLDQLLEAAQLAVGSDGFNLVLIVASGNVRSGNAATDSFLRQVPTYQMALVSPGELVGSLEDLLQGVPNLVTIQASRAR